jgi:hypothetical protein
MTTEDQFVMTLTFACSDSELVSIARFLAIMAASTMQTRFQRQSGPQRHSQDAGASATSPNLNLLMTTLSNNIQYVARH